MKRLIVPALAVVIVGVVVAVWLGGTTPAPEPVVTAPEPMPVDSLFRYPPELWDRQVEGETVVMARVNPAGSVDSAYVVESSGEPAFDSVAISGARATAFTPGTRDGEAVSEWVRLPVRFRMPPDVMEPAGAGAEAGGSTDPDTEDAS